MQGLRCSSFNPHRAIKILPLPPQIAKLEKHVTPICGFGHDKTVPVAGHCQRRRAKIHFGGYGRSFKCCANPGSEQQQAQGLAQASSIGISWLVAPV
jgi:hypothetical protein